MINTKTKGELGIRIEYDVEHDLFHPQNIYSDEYITPTFVEYVQKIEKENAELKADLDEKENTVHTLDVLHKEAVRKYGEVNDQLTKAKELLKQWVELFKPKGGNIPPTPIQVDTEQFLKESK